MRHGCLHLVSFPWDCPPAFPHSVSFLSLMPGVWLKQDAEGAQWAQHFSVAAAERHLSSLGVRMWPEQIKREATRDGTKHGWVFSYTDPTVVPESPAVECPPVESPTRPVRTTCNPIFLSPDKKCPVCNAKLTGHTKQCVCCAATVHELCSADLPRGFSCYACVCIACKADLKGPTEKCSKCKWVVHQACCPPVSGSLVCHACCPLAPKTPPPKATIKRTFKAEWCKGRPWLQYVEGEMICNAECRACKAAA